MLRSITPASAAASTPNGDQVEKEQACAQLGEALEAAGSRGMPFMVSQQPVGAFLASRAEIVLAPTRCPSR